MSDPSDDWGDPWHGRHVDHDPPARVVWRDGGWRPATVIARPAVAGGLWEADLSTHDSYGPIKRQAALLFRRGLSPEAVLAQLRADLPARVWPRRVTSRTLWLWQIRYGWRPTARRAPRSEPEPAPVASVARWRCCGQVRPGSCPACGRVSPLAPDTQ